MNRKPIDANESKKIMVEVLKVVHDYCCANNLKYSLYAGTLIGAVRHNGFIPWDDDIDIVMPRNDYEYFIKHFKAKNYDIITPYNSNEYYLPWAKVYDNRTIKIEPVNLKSEFLFGIDIDVFPVDYVDSFESFETVQRLKHKYDRKRNIALSNISWCNPFKNPRYFLIVLYRKLFYVQKQSYFARKIDKCYKRFNKRPHKFLMVNSLFSKRPPFNVDLFNNLELHKFENYCFFIFRDYDYFLRLIFGDYTLLPPVNEQVTHHTNQQFYK